MNTPTSAQDPIDNYFRLACLAAHQDLQYLFEKQFKFELSDFVQQTTGALQDSYFSRR